MLPTKFQINWLCSSGVKKSPSPTPGASNLHIWASWSNQLYARRASKNIYRILTNLSIFAYLLISYIHICYMLFNQQQCFIYSTASFLSKLRAKKVEKLCILVIKQLQQTTAYRKFRKWNIGFRNRKQLFLVIFFFFSNN